MGFINLLAPDLVNKYMVPLQAPTFVNILLKRHTRNAITFSSTIKKHRHEVKSMLSQLVPEYIFMKVHEKYGITEGPNGIPQR